MPDPILSTILQGIVNQNPLPSEVEGLKTWYPAGSRYGVAVSALSFYKACCAMHPEQEFDKLPEFEVFLQFLDYRCVTYKQQFGKPISRAHAQDISRSWRQWIQFQFDPPPTWYRKDLTSSLLTKLESLDLVKGREATELPRLPGHVIAEMLWRALKNPDERNVRASLLLMLPYLLCSRLDDIIAGSVLRPGPGLQWKDISIRLNDLTLKGAVLEIKIKHHKSIENHGMQPMIVRHVWDARNGPIDPIHIILLQAMHTGQIDDPEAMMLNALETNDGAIVWAYPERPVIAALNDPEKPLTQYSTCKNAIVGLAKRTNFSLEACKLVFHAIRRGAIRDIVLCPQKYLMEGLPTEALAFCLHHSLLSFEKGVTKRYTKNLRLALWNERLYEIRIPDNEGLHLYFKDIPSPFREQARLHGQNLENGGLDDEEHFAVEVANDYAGLIVADEAAADLEGFGAEMEEDGEHTVDEEVLAGRTLVASEGLHRSPTSPSDKMPEQTDLFTNAGASRSSENLVRDHASATPAISQSPASLVSNNEYKLFDAYLSTVRFDFGVSNITPAGAPPIVACSSATSEAAHTMTQIPTSHVAITRDPAVLMGEQVVVRAPFGANEAHIIGAHGKESAQDMAGRGQEWGQGFQGVERPSMHRDVAGHAWTNIGDGFGGSHPYHSGVTSQTASAHVMGSPSAQARPDDIALGGFVPRSSIHSQLLSGMKAPQMSTSQPYDVETSALRDRPDNAMLDNSTVGGVVDPTASLGERRCQSLIPRTSGTESPTQRAWPIDPTLDQWAAQTSLGSTGVPHPAQTFAPSANTVAGSAFAVSNGYSSLDSLIARLSAGTALERQNSSQSSKRLASKNKNKTAPLRSIQVSTSWLDDADVSTIDLANPPNWLFDSGPGRSNIPLWWGPTALVAHPAESGSSAPTSASNKRQKTGSKSCEPRSNETESTYICEMPKCRKGFATFQERARHYIEEHYFTPCPFPGCTMLYRGKEYNKMNEHLRTHVANISVCLYGDCFRVFRRTEDYVRHQLESHDMAQCPMVGCLETHQNNSSIMKHFHKEHLPIDQHLSTTTLQCRHGCDQVLFSTLPELKAHVVDVHKMEVCPTQSCYIFFPLNRGHDVLWSHAKSHKDAAENVMEKERYALTYIAQPGTTITVDLVIKIVDGQKQYACLHAGCTWSHVKKERIIGHMREAHHCSSIVRVKN